ncbi:hypothetical protein K1X12_09890 [Hyphomonas sp. WL0036]|uniref:DUF6607 family protein n=1 Tax=Hyphomonas sediminis TaxID=2866160 RepID=UPI001C80CB47|nr:DUF6607 family protein [Hyphomonas sediminis]MBY9067210.1 hypothetical protein [Hyphomonas sediminis]
MPLNPPAPMKPGLLKLGCAVMALSLAACAATNAQTALATPPPAAERADAARFEQDRQSILAMAGDYKVSFDFIETVSFNEDYIVMPPKISGAQEVVRVIEDRGDFISLQHILVASHGDAAFPIKHWRQDWQYEPARILSFIGGNAWEWRDIPQAERKGKWSQTVYQVDDAPRYSALAAWSYELGPATWAPGHEWRPLPRRDMTTRNDYHTINAVNRHVITPLGWVHEQDNDKVVLSSGVPVLLAREVGVNTYERDSDFPVDVALDYWTGTADFWTEIRDEWAKVASEAPAFGLTIQGETEALYMPLLELAEKYAAGDVALAEAAAEGRALVRAHVTFDLDPLAERVAATPKAGDKS